MELCDTRNCSFLDEPWRSVSGYGIDFTYDSTHEVLYAGCHFQSVPSQSTYTGKGVWRCTNPRTAPSWTNTGGGVSSCIVESLAYDPSHDVLYAGGREANRSRSPIGVWRCDTPRTAPSWINTGGGVNGNLAYSLAYDSTHDYLYAGTLGHGVWRCASPDTSPAWTDTGGGANGITTLCLACDTSHDMLYAGCFDLSSQRRLVGVWRCSNPRTSSIWTNTGGVVSGYNIKALAYDSTNDVLYVGEMYEHGVWRCTSPSTSPVWTKAGEGLSNCGITALTYDSVNDVLFAGPGTGHNNAIAGVWRFGPNKAH